MSDQTVENLTPAEVAARVLADIERLGHYQDTGSNELEYWEKGVRDDGPACLLVNPTVESLGGLAEPSTPARWYQRTLEEVLPVDPVQWNDTHTTEEVKALLTKLIAGDTTPVEPTDVDRDEDEDEDDFDANDDGDTGVDD